MTRPIRLHQNVIYITQVFRNALLQADSCLNCTVAGGTDSPLNVSKPLKENSRQTSQRAELMAALVALNQIERLVNQERDLDLFVILTDSAYLVNSLTSYIYKWRENDYRSASGREVANRDLFERLDYKLNAMANGRQGIDVLFCKVDRSENEEADRLSREGAEMH